MAVLAEPRRDPRMHTFSASQDVDSAAQPVFALLCAVEKWPVWLPFVRSAKLAGAPLSLESDVIVRSNLPGEEEQHFEVDAFVANYHLSLVGAYSVRRRIDFRVEQKTARTKVHLRVSYPAYHGRVGAALERWRRGKRLNAALEAALLHFKGLIERQHDDLAVVDQDC